MLPSIHLPFFEGMQVVIVRSGGQCGLAVFVEEKKIGVAGGASRRPYGN